MAGHNQLKDTFIIDLRSLDMCSLWTHFCMPMRTDFINLLHRNVKKNLIFHTLVYVAAYAACFRWCDAAWRCEFRIKDNVEDTLFEVGLSHWEVIHSRSLRKGTLGCIAESFEYLKRKTLIISNTLRLLSDFRFCQSEGVQNVKNPQHGGGLILGGKSWVSFCACRWSLQSRCVSGIMIQLTKT